MRVAIVVLAIGLFLCACLCLPTAIMLSGATGAAAVYTISGEPMEPLEEPGVVQPEPDLQPGGEQPGQGVDPGTRGEPAVDPGSARGACLHGEVLWADSTRTDGYEHSPIGGLEESRWIVGETWRMVNGQLDSFVFVLPPRTIAWLSGHYGGTGWGLCVHSEQEAERIADQNVQNVLERDGIEPTLIVLPEDSSLFPLLDELQE